MRIEVATSFVGALACHGVLLFGMRLGTPARPLPTRDATGSVDVELIADAAGTAATETAFEPVQEPEKSPEPPPLEPEVAPPPVAPVPLVEPQPAMPETRPTASPTAVPSVPPSAEPPPRRTARSKRGVRSPVPASRTGVSGVAGSGSRAGATAARPRGWSNPKPDYPPEARSRSEEGVVLVHVEVNVGGRPTQVSVQQSSGFGLLDDAALDAVRRWRFDPALAGGLPVTSAVNIPVRFSLRR